MKIILTRTETDQHLRNYFSLHGLPLIESVDIVDPAPAAKPMVEVDPDFIQYPDSTLPCGLFVPAFKYAVRPCTKGTDGRIAFDPSAKPWVNINYNDAVTACAASGFQLSRESQELAIRLDIVKQDINWTGGKVGAGNVYQGIHKDNVSGAQPANYESSNPEERSWHQLSTGHKVYGLAGNIWTWTHDDIQGNDKGLAGKIAADSPSLTTAPYPSLKNGMGWRPDGALDWSGHALIRGGYWSSRSYSGVFTLFSGSPDSDPDGVGFRCTQ